MVGINEELEAAEAARAALSTNSNSKATIKVLREAKYVAALAMTTLPSDKPLNDARHAVVTALSEETPVRIGVRGGPERTRTSIQFVMKLPRGSAARRSSSPILQDLIFGTHRSRQYAMLGLSLIPAVFIHNSGRRQERVCGAHSRQ